MTTLDAPAAAAAIEYSSLGENTSEKDKGYTLSRTQGYAEQGTNTHSIPAHVFEDNIGY